MKRVVRLFALAAFTVTGLADAPDLNPGPDKNIREQGIASLFLQASDPDGDQITYRWVISSDPTGRAFFRTTTGDEPTVIEGSSGVRVGLRQGPNFPEPSYVGQTIQVTATVSDGENNTEHTYNLPVVGVNLPPVVRVDTSQLGTRGAPRMAGEGLGLDARESSDPDSGNVKFLWRITSVSGGSTCESVFVLFGKETLTPGLVVPEVTARRSNPMTITLEYFVEDGLHFLTGTYTGYMASEHGCNSAPPRVSAEAQPALAFTGQRVTLRGDATDPGDQLRFSWVQLDTTGEPTVVLSDPEAATTTFLAPAFPTDLKFRFTATDSKNQSASADVKVEVKQGTPPPPDTVPPGPAPGVTVCGEEGNEPARAQVPAGVRAQAGESVSIRAKEAEDPDDTEVFVGGVVASGVTFQWQVMQGAGLLENGDLLGARTEEVSFTLPESTSDRSLQLSLLVNDAAGCGTRYAVEVLVSASAAPPGGPDAVLRYRLEGDQSLLDAPPAAVDLTSPGAVVLDARSSQTTGSASYHLDLDSTLEGGDAALAEMEPGVWRLEFPENSFGKVAATMTVEDESGKTDAVGITFQVLAPDDPPRAHLRYRVGGEGDLRDVSGEPVRIAPPAEVLLDATRSTDEQPLQYSFVMQETLFSGGAVLSQPAEGQALVEVKSGTLGSVTITATVTDKHGSTDSASVKLSIDDVQTVPRAAISVMLGDRPRRDGESVREDTIVTLDGRASDLSDGSQPEGLEYAWRQTAGVPVALLDADTAVARFRVPEMEGSAGALRFELTVSKDGVKSDPEAVELPVSAAPLYFSQVAFGPFLEKRFQTVLLLINDRSEDVQARVGLFDQEGLPLAAGLEGEPDWSADVPLQIEAGGSRRLRFSPLEQERTVVGWARVESSLRLTGLVLYQLRDRQSGELGSEVSLYSSPAADSHRTFFDAGYGLAAALLNPGTEPILARLMLTNAEHGPDNPLASKLVQLEAGTQSAFFLDESLFGDSGGPLPVATLLIEAEGGLVAVTVLKTSGGLAISSLPVASR